MENVECLMNFGLTRQEANLYVLLVLEGELNGYEAAKKSGISRSNTYNALAGLVEKGAAYMSEEDTVKYQAVPVEEFCENRLRDLTRSKEELVAKLPKQRMNKGAYLTVKGEKQILDKFTNMLLETRERVYVSASNEKLTMFRPYFADLVGRGIKVVIITNEPFDLEETLARIESSLRRAKLQIAPEHALEFQELTLDVEAHTVQVKGRELTLTAKEYKILELLMRYPDKIFSKSNLFQSVWNSEYFSEDNTLNVHISNLRNKMRTLSPDFEYIDTVWASTSKVSS